MSIPALTVAEVHDKVDELERALRQRFPAIKRVIGHAEPQRACTIRFVAHTRYFAPTPASRRILP